MASARIGIVAGFLAAGGLAAAAWFLLVAPARRAEREAVRDAQESARRSDREAADARQWAQTEQERRRFFEERAKELERQMSSGAPPAAVADGKTGETPRGPHDRMGPVGPPPEEWDRARLNAEIENLAANPSVLATHPRLPLVLRALRHSGDAGRELVLQILRAGISPGHDVAAGVFAEALGEARAAPLLVTKARTEKDPTSRYLLLRALANLPGDDGLALFHELWQDPAADAQTRKFAIQGLALRGDAVARAVADGTTQVPATQRVRAVEFLRDHAERTAWGDTSLIPVFGRALRTADGPAQVKLAILALEGFWSRDALPDLDAFAADPSAPIEMATRAKSLADALRRGDARPANAGVPERRMVLPEDAVLPPQAEPATPAQPPQPTPQKPPEKQ